MDRRQLRWSSAQETSAACFLHPGRKPDPLPSIVDIQAARIQTRRADGTDALPGNVAVYCLHRVHLTVESNACAESFFHSLKVEAIHGERFGTREEMRQTVFEYIEVDYNRTRRHSTNGFISPEAFEAKNVA